MTGARPRLLLDEMFTPLLARRLGALGHDVVAVAHEPGLRGRSDEAIHDWARVHGRRVVTENVKDFAALVMVDPEPGVLFTSSRSFPRSRRDPGPLLAALTRWIDERAPSAAAADWLQPG